MAEEQVKLHWVTSHGFQALKNQCVEANTPYSVCSWVGKTGEVFKIGVYVYPKKQERK